LADAHEYRIAVPIFRIAQQAGDDGLPIPPLLT
jgi:hypothetical protein